MKKLILLTIVAGALFIPFIEADYYTGEGIETKKYSIATSLAEDVKESNFMTLELMLNK
ncbi:MAG TPA: hypothetical protein GX707_06250 [Epulopiscium sp.]|nr:hypothetical protein [Candidatus Epulonipiscium sp.]